MTEQPPSVGAVLEQDHRRIDEQLGVFARSLGSGEPDAAALTAGSAGLRHHIFVEEELHFPALRAAGMLAPILVMLREHGEIWDLLDALEAGVADSAPPADLLETWQQLERVLTEHNMKEERILYPAGDDVLDAGVAEEVLSNLSSGETPDGWTCQMAGRA